MREARAAPSWRGCVLGGRGLVVCLYLQEPRPQLIAWVDAQGQAFWGGSARCASASAATEGAIAAAPTTTGKRQPVDYTTVVAIAAELNRDWVPAKVEQALQVRRITSLCLSLLLAMLPSHRSPPRPL